jgi:heat-inducible transcriptional repressor
MCPQTEIHDRLTKREELILQATVQSYITTAEPVGSRAIVKRFGLDLSPATVRNVMADLEESGYLEQLHTSSGRVPTDLGYRYYVNFLMRVQELTSAEQDRLESDFQDQMSDTESLMRHTSHMLALVSHHAGIVTAPRDSSAALSRIELMPVNPTRVAVLMADSFGRVHTTVVEQESAIADEELARVCRFMNENFKGVALEQLTQSVENGLRQYLDDQRQIAERAASILGMVPADRPGQLFLEGTAHLFEQPEFHDLGKARDVLHLLEERERLAGLLRTTILEDEHGRARVTFGSEAHGGGLADISVVSAPYHVGDKTVGVLGVLGPRRMPFSRLSALVDYSANMLSRFLTKVAG